MVHRINEGYREYGAGSILINICMKMGLLISVYMKEQMHQLRYMEQKHGVLKVIGEGKLVLEMK